MKITLNGHFKEFPNALHLGNLVEQFCKDKTPVITELNGEIIKDIQRKHTPLKDGDSVELVSFVGGGSIDNRCSLFVDRGNIF